MADNDDVEFIKLEYKDLEKALDKFNKKMPGISKKLMNAVNNEVKKQVRRAYKSEGYRPTVQRSWGDSGYRKNLKSFSGKNYSAKIFIAKDAFYYRFLEFGTNHKEMMVHRKGQYYKVRGFSVPANPILYPIANSIWKTERAIQIMDKKFQDELNKMMEKK